VFLGPLAVAADVRKFGTGGALVQAACEAAQAAGFASVLLVGDEPYFSRFGFSAAPARAVRLPGPVDQRRVLVRARCARAAPRAFPASWSRRRFPSVALEAAAPRALPWIP
jgi:predicted N-acetyltransferase YhbS